MKKVKIALIIFIIIAICGLSLLISVNNSTEVKTIGSQKELIRIKEHESPYSEKIEYFKQIIAFNAARLYNVDMYFDDYYVKSKNVRRRDYPVVDYDTVSSDISMEAKTMSSSISVNGASSTSLQRKDYSTTNIQVENVDEADINKTDGNYIYSISENHVMITDVRNPKEIKIASKINDNTNLVPEDLILYNNKLVVIYDYVSSSRRSSDATVVKTYDISSRENPKEIKSFKLKQDYYTSRCIDNKLYIIASSELEYDKDSEKDKVDISYEEDGEKKNIPLKNITYLKNSLSTTMSVICAEDLDDVDKEIKVSAFLMNIENAYVSEESIYLLDEESGKTESVEKKELLKALFSLGGVNAFKEAYEDGNDYTRGTYTAIYKFDIKKNGEVKFVAKSTVDGKTINQYSLDEKDGHLRIATYDSSKGAKITIFDENLNQIGNSERVGENEIMHATRFMGDKAYVVTYRNTDPLFVIDLKDERHPKVLGELSIPGYSEYLHPYDENHIIGIGMETKENIRKDANGKVLSTSVSVIGMKMALFDVSDVRNPKQMSQVIIGDRRTTSAILSNQKHYSSLKKKN